MTFEEFFRLDQQQWYEDFRESELPRNFSGMLVSDEFPDQNSEFARIP